MFLIVRTPISHGDVWACCARGVKHSFFCFGLRIVNKKRIFDLFNNSFFLESRAVDSGEVSWQRKILCRYSLPIFSAYILRRCFLTIWIRSSLLSSDSPPSFLPPLRRPCLNFPFPPFALSFSYLERLVASVLFVSKGYKKLQEKERKTYLKFDEQHWEQVRTFVIDIFPKT